MADIFISYTSSDCDWAFWIANELRALGHTPHIHEWEIKGGDDIYAWMEQRHDAADHALCVVSDEYLKAPYSTLERNAALWQAAAKRPGFVLLVAVKPCRLPTLTDQIRRCELFGVPEEAARVRFREFMARRASPATVAFPGKAFAVSNITIRVPTHFMGRDDSLAAIAAALARYEGRVAIMALHGLRGVGKTTLAAAYAERHRADYRATWWIRAQTEPTMRADLVALGVRLGWVSDEKEERALAAVMERLRQEGEGALLIYDNAPNAKALSAYLPRGGLAQVLITSNDRAWRGVAAPIEIRLWPKEIGADYLIARTGRVAERAAAIALSEALDGLPLAHEQAAAYCEQLDIPLAEYARRFEAAPAQFLGDARYTPMEYNDGMTVSKSFALAIEEASKVHPAAESLIVYAALLGTEPIPIFLFAETRAILGEPLASALAGEGLDEAVAALRSFALVDRETIPDESDPAFTTDCIRLHRLVRQVAAGCRDAEAQDDARRVLIEALAAVYPGEVFNHPKSWLRARRLNALMLFLVGEDSRLPSQSEARAAYLLNNLGSYHHGAIAAYHDARRDFERALAMREKVFGQDHLLTAVSLNNLALLLQECGDLSAARPLYERALAIREKRRGPEHCDTATSLNNLAFLLKLEGDLLGARSLYERALTIYQNVLGLEHPLTATALNNLGRLLQAQGDFEGALPLFESALAIHERLNGPEHPLTAIALANLGRLLQDQGDLNGARPLQERALSIREKVLGPEHPSTATNLNDLADLLLAQGDVSRSRPMFERALAIHERVAGPEHSNTNRVRYNLARALLASAKPEQARALGEAALAAHEKALGSNHEWTKNSARVTADALDALGRAGEAAQLRTRYAIAGRDALEH